MLVKLIIKSILFKLNKNIYIVHNNEYDNIITNNSSSSNSSSLINESDHCYSLCTLIVNKNKKKVNLL